MGVPFVHQGRTRRGLDCIGLLELALHDAGMGHYAAHPANRTDYGRDPHRGLLEQRLREIFGEPVADMRPGDVVALRYAGPIRHVGLIGDHQHGLSLIHTDSHLGRVTEHRIDDRWATRIALVFRPEVSA
ncbi:NlpC/P60 family protein [Lysobacter korlensis]|uniref:NlpC/P60 family protein n=1 Tax=Lysobacter korlensis TaxID=553636 RepID=A0ABV6RMC1_9GAMM